MVVRIAVILSLSMVLVQSLVHANPACGRATAPTGGGLGDSAMSVAMERWGPRPAVQATINGKGPFRLLIDTGTSFPAVLMADLAEELALSETKQGTGSAASDPSGPVILESIGIGNAQFVDVKALIESTTVSYGGAAGIRGILGLPLFESCMLTLDFANNRVVLESGELPVNEETIPYSSDQEGDFGVTVGLSVGGVPVKAHVDTGSPSFITLLTKWEGRLSLAGESRVVGMAYTPSGGSEVRQAKLDGIVRLGGLAFGNPTIDFADLGPMLDFDAGNIGSGLLKDLAMAIDQKNRRIRLRRGDSPAEAPDGEVRIEVSDQPYRVGIAFALTEEVRTVDFVAPAGPGYRGGLMAGDALLTVNGKPSADVHEPELQKLCGAPEPIIFEVRRDGETLSITVTPEPR
jgi:predicted aspartyl protease